MNQVFTELPKTLTKLFNLQSVDLSEEETSFISSFFSDSLSFHQKIQSCRSENQKENLNCILKVLEDTPCKTQIKDLNLCIKSLNRNVLTPKSDLVGFCYKQDRNLLTCVSDLSAPILFTKSGLPPKLPYSTS